MSSISDNAIVLRRWPFSETSQTVAMLTREHGVLRGLAKGARRARGSFSGGFDVLTRGQIVAIIKPNADLVTLTEWRLEETYAVIRRDLDANRAAAHMADLVLHFLTDHDPHPHLYDQLVNALDSISGDGSTALALVRFQLAQLRECGYQPQLDRDVATGQALCDSSPMLAFNPGLGGLVNDTGRPGCWRVRRETVELLRALQCRPEALTADQSAPVVLNRAARLLASYSREVIGRDLPSIRWLFPPSSAGRAGGTDRTRGTMDK